MTVLGHTIAELSSYDGLKYLCWSLCLGWVVIACIKGHGGPINTFLSSRVFAILGRLTYMVFLINQDMILIFYNSFTYTIVWSPLLTVSCLLLTNYSYEALSACRCIGVFHFWFLAY